MKAACLLATAALLVMPATAQQYASNQGYKVCPTNQTFEGLRVVEEVCGRLDRPEFGNAHFSSIHELEAARLEREAFSTKVDSYGRCVTQFINSYRRPGAPADSKAPDQAACAHAWAEDQATQVVRDYGRACIEYSNRSVIDTTLDDFTGECFPAFQSGRG